MGRIVKDPLGAFCPGDDVTLDGAVETSPWMAPSRVR
jgi:hypothetical protein